MNTTLFPQPQAFASLPNLKTDGSVAIITRTKNRAVLLARALNSVLEQRYQNWHLYVVNDGGDVATVEKLLDTYRDLFGERLTVIHNPQSLGMEAASNCAFERANEEFLVIHDDDDSWHPDFLQETVAFLQKNRDAVAVLTNCVVIHEEIKQDTVRQLNVLEWGYWRDHADAVRLIKGNITPPICLLIRMSAAKTIGGYNAALPVLGDWDYNLRLFRLGEIKTLNKELAYYHHRVSSNDAYGNSVIAGVDKHQAYQAAYRNALVRRALAEDPANYGLLHLILHDAENNKNELLREIQDLKYRLDNVGIGHHANRDAELFARVDYFYRKCLPMRNLAAKWRERMRKMRRESKVLRPLAHQIRDMVRVLRGKRK